MYVQEVLTHLYSNLLYIKYARISLTYCKTYLTLGTLYLSQSFRIDDLNQ